MAIDLLGAIVSGFLSAMTVFLFAAGLTLVFGILRILNFSHGGFFMIGAYLALLMLSGTGGQPSLPMFILVAVASAIAVGLAGIVVERLVFSRLRDVDEAFSLIATYALLLLTEGAVKVIWGVGYHSASVPSGLDGAVFLGDIIVPSYSLFIAGCGLALYLALEWTMHRTDLGKLVRALANDPWMTSVLGVNVPRYYAVIVVVSFLLAGLAGALLLPNQSLSPTLANAFVIQAFGALIVGGMGNIRGAFAAAIILCVVDAIGNVLVPDYPGLFFYVAMATALLIKPQGLVSGERI